ncbi:hypothetical protein KR49_11845 [Synechococcus sp. KORDI-49]|nr:hypothetical protein KR49_11845 [Synechococcus sp. KORDI-49]
MTWLKGEPTTTHSKETMVTMYSKGKAVTTGYKDNSAWTHCMVVQVRMNWKVQRVETF